MRNTLCWQQIQRHSIQWYCFTIISAHCFAYRIAANKMLLLIERNGSKMKKEKRWQCVLFSNHVVITTSLKVVEAFLEGDTKRGTSSGFMSLRVLTSITWGSTTCECGFCFELINGVYSSLISVNRSFHSESVFVFFFHQNS